MKIVFLIGSYVPHQMTTLDTLIKMYEVEIHSFSISKNFTYIPENNSKLKTYKLQHFKRDELLKIINNLTPQIIITSGWMIPEYIWVCKKIKKSSNIPIVAMSDTPWYATWKQRVNVIISPFHIKKAFTHIWVAGIRQYDYARKLGYSNQQIIFNSLSANNSIFNQVDIQAKRNSYPKNFLFIGRFTKLKGLENLINAWADISDKKGWTFTLIGDGEMKKELKNNGQFIVKDYMTQKDLLSEMQKSGCFVLPSLFEPWALVIHEAAAAGLPIVCTEGCGAAPHFVINNYNGYRIKDNSERDLKLKLEDIVNKSTTELLEFSVKSRGLSNSINPELQIASLMQLLHEK